MVALLQWFHRRLVVDDEKSDGLDLAITTIEALPHQLFNLRGPRMRYKKKLAEEIVQFIREVLPPYYHYSSCVKRKRDNKGTMYMRLEIEGWAGIRAEHRRPSLFDVSYVITTKI